MCVIKYYLAIKGNEVLMSVTIQVDFQNMLRGISQSQQTQIISLFQNIQGRGGIRGRTKLGQL